MDHRPNQVLSAEERSAKRELKRRLKEQHHHHKLAVRLRNAELRGEQDLVDQTRRELESCLLLMAGKRSSETATAVAVDDYLLLHQEDLREIDARAFVEQIYHELQKTWRHQQSASPTVSSKTNDDNNDGRSAGNTADPRCYRNQPNPQFTLRTVKERRLQESRALLRKMTQGVLELADFQSLEALRGYTRKKFIERANLVVKSLGNLRNIQQKGHYHRTGTTPARVVDFLLQCLYKVRSLCSIGCGPGCDAVGVVAFLRSQRQQQQHLETTSEYLLDHAFLLDWATPHWLPILQTVEDLLVRRHHAVRQFETSTCDVRASLFLQQQQQQQQHPEISHNEAGAVEDGMSLLSPEGPASDGASDGSGRFWNADLIVVSYLLSEMRCKWCAFFDDLVGLSPVGRLFLFTDATSWQMHLFRERYEFFHDDDDDDDKISSNNGNSGNGDRKRRMNFVWLDSSMYRPDLQELEGRNGPAVLLGVIVCRERGGRHGS